MGRHRKTSARHLTAGVDPSLYADFAVGDRVRVKEGLLGVVTAVEDGPFPGTEQYQVTLDDGMGGGTWGAGEVVAAGPTTAAATEAMVVEAMPFEATGLHTAAEDYPELQDILVERPPLPHSEPMRMFASKEAAAVDWADVAQHYWCTSCGFSGDLAPSGDDDICPSCGHVEPYFDLDGRSPSEFGKAAARAEQHVLISTASLWDRVIDTGANILNSQMDEEFQVKPGTSLDPARGNWCRFRKNERCFFPKTLNEAATAEAGYAVWNPEDRGRCPRNSWDQQRDCPVAEPGPKSGDPQARLDATVRWEDGGQRIPADWVITHDDYDPRYSSLAKQTAFEFTASWTDVRNKAKRIRSEGGVRIISAPRDENELTITAEVKGDSEVYETTLLREPGRKNIASWSCGCAWSSYSWGRSGRWKKYEGRMCSHALAVQYEAQAQGMNGGQVRVQPQTPPWRVNKNPFEYAKAASLRPVCLDGDLAEAPLARVQREASLSVTAKAMLFRNLKALVRGGIRAVEFVMGGKALVKGVGEVPLSEITYPSWHPSLGLSLSHHATLAHVVDGSDGPHIPGTDEHYPYDEQWADPSRWGRNHFGVWGDDLFVFEPSLSVEMEQGDPAGAASWTPEIGIEAQRIDIGQGRDVPWGHLPSGMNNETEFVGDFLTPHPEGFVDALGDYTAPVETEGALPFTTGDEGLEAVAHTEALVVEALDSPEMAEAVGQSLTTAPPGPGDSRLSWLMDGAASNPGAGGGTPATASNDDIAAAAKATLAKMALKAFSPEEQAEIINEGIDVQAANLDALDIAGTHYEGLEAALREAEDEDDFL